ncbi:MAG: hypothetical protein RLO52_33845 [Sandaracinaceae bacterium]
MNVDVRAPGTHPSSDLGGFRLTAWDDVNELLAFRDARRAAEPGTQLLFILDDAGQAAYTSGHARDTHGLSDLDPAQLPAEEQALYEKRGRLTPERWAAEGIPRLRAKARETTLTFTQQLIPIDDPDVELLSLYRDVSLAFGTPLDCLTIATTDPSMAIAALPNGYFVGDLTPMENYHLAEHLRTAFGYEVLGLGSYLAAYVRDEPVTAEEARAVIESVRGLYEMTDDVVAEWASAVTGLRWLLLSYQGS